MRIPALAERIEHTPLGDNDMGWQGIWRFRLVDNKTGAVERDFTVKNMLHNLGEQALLQGMFSPAGTMFTVLSTDAAYGHELAILTAGTNGDFASVAAGDFIYVVGGEQGARITTPGAYEVHDVNAAAEPDTLEFGTSAGAADINGNVTVTGGITVLRQKRLAIALDARQSPAEADVIGQMEAYEEDGAGYGVSGAGRQMVCPNDSTNWTIALDSTTNDYKATSAQVTFAATDTDWQANYNASLVMFDGTIASPTNEVLIATAPFDDPITVADGKSMYVDIYIRLGEES
jgi:hypothetical protein